MESADKDLVTESENWRGRGLAGCRGGIRPWGLKERGGRKERTFIVARKKERDKKGGVSTARKDRKREGKERQEHSEVLLTTQVD